MNGYDDGKNPDPIGRIVSIAIILMLIILVAIQIGIAKERQLERDAVYNNDITTEGAKTNAK